MVLQTVAAMGSLHGYGIARRIEQVSGDNVLLNQGTIYAALPEGWDEQRRNADHDQPGTLITSSEYAKDCESLHFPRRRVASPAPWLGCGCRSLWVLVHQVVRSFSVLRVESPAGALISIFRAGRTYLVRKR
jgi:hypothetical protein